MIPANVDMQSLEDQLEADGIAFGAISPANAALEGHLATTLGATDLPGIGSVGVVVLDTTPAQPADLRDIARDLADATQLDTVIVRTPGASGAVSDRLTRAGVEEGQRAMMAQPDYGDGLRAFLDTAVGSGAPWAALGFAAIVALAVIAAATFAATRRLVKR